MVQLSFKVIFAHVPDMSYTHFRCVPDVSCTHILHLAKRAWHSCTSCCSFIARFVLARTHLVHIPDTCRCYLGAELYRIIRCTICAKLYIHTVALCQTLEQKRKETDGNLNLVPLVLIITGTT